jgi:hypothetical protein
VKEKMLYIINSLIVPIDFDKYPSVTVTLRKVTVEEAKALLFNQNFVSAVGHEATAQLLTRLFGVTIQFNRITVFMQPGDKALHFFLKTRIPEGKVLTEDELRRLDFWLILSEVQS